MPVTTLPKEEYLKEAIRLRNEEDLPPKKIRERLGEPSWDNVDYWLKSAGKDKQGNRKLSLPTLESRRKNQANSSQARNKSLIQQTHGDAETFGDQTPEGFQDHHGRPDVLYRPFFDGLNEADAAELARFSAEELMTPLGDKSANLNRIPNTVHHDHHNFLRDNPGLERGLTKTLKDASLEQRKQALKVFVENIQPALDEDLFSRMQRHAHSQLLNATRSKVARRALGLVPFIGAIPNAIDAAERTQLAAETNDPLDKLQAGIAATSVASTGWAEPVGFAADVANTAIDFSRWAFPDDYVYTQKDVDLANEWSKDLMRK